MQNGRQQGLVFPSAFCILTSAFPNGGLLMSQATLSRPSLAERYAAAFARSRRLYEQARGVFPDGVTHDLRHLAPFPVYVDRALGGHKWTVDGQELTDYWSGHGAILLGHSH